MYTKTLEVDQTPDLFYDLELINLLRHEKLSASGPFGLLTFILKWLGIWLSKPYTIWWTPTLTRIIIEILQWFCHTTITRPNHVTYTYRPQVSTTTASVHIPHTRLDYPKKAAGSALRVISIHYSKAFASAKHVLLIGKLHTCRYDLSARSIAIIR